MDLNKLYQNLDGLGNFSEAQIIAENIPVIEDIIIYDLNSDEKLDIVYRTNLDKIAWLENIDGLGAFCPEQIIADTNYPYSISASDIDNDGDVDVFANLYHDSFNNRLVWYENIDGLGTFSGENIIEIGDEFYGDGGGSILLNFDLDNDGDNDLITSYERHQSSKLIWYENLDGLGNLSPSQELHQFQYNPLSDFASILSLGHSDINGDGNIDIIASTFFDDGEVSGFNIVWLENIDEQGLFGSPHAIHNFITFSMSFHDLDNDGDNDVLSNYNNEIYWFKNEDGLGDFSDKITISLEVDNSFDSNAADFNNDGLLDVVSASANDNKVAWYENGVLEIDDNTKQTAILYPNPTKNTVSISSEVDTETIKIYNVLGERLTTNIQNNTVDLSKYNSGVYFIKIQDANGSIEAYKIIKE